jgi:hypothetical protein
LSLTPAAAQTDARDTVSGNPPPASAAAADAPASSTYKLVQVAGRELPVEVDKGLRCRDDVVSGTLSLQENRWRLETTKRETCGDRTREELDSDDGRYRMEGQSIRFFDEDGEANDKDWDLIGKEIDLDEMTTGTLGTDGTLTVQLADEKTTLVFRRQ